MTKTLMQKFRETFLTESSQNLISGFSDGFFILQKEIEEFKKAAYNIQQISSNLYCLDTNDSQYYWITNGYEPIIITRVEKLPLGFVVRLTGKNSIFKKKPPTAATLYKEITAYTHKDLVSDNSITENGFKIWSDLFNMGCKISVYNKDASGKSFKRIESIDELKIYFDSSVNYKKFQFILSESQKQFAELNSVFGLRRIRELVNREADD